MWLVFVLLACVLSVSPAWAWPVSLSWGPVTGATSYKVEKSTDGGTTWTSVGTPTVPSFSYTGTETGLVIFRVSACNAVTCTVRYGDGLWHNEAWVPPAPAGNLSTQ